MTSPSAERRKTRTDVRSDGEAWSLAILRPSTRVLHPFDELGGGVLLRIADDGHPPPQRFDEGALRHALDRVVRSLAMDVGTDGTDQLLGRRLVKDGDEPDAPNGSDDLPPLVFRLEGPCFLRQGIVGVVAVDSDDEHVRFQRGGLQIADVTDMEDAEASVRQGDASAGSPLLGDRPDDAFPIEDGSVHSASSSSRSMAWRSSSLLAVAVPIFMTTMPPA